MARTNKKTSEIAIGLAILVFVGVMYMVYFNIMDKFKVGQCIYTLDKRYTPSKQVSTYRIDGKGQGSVRVSMLKMNKWDLVGTMNKNQFKNSAIFEYSIRSCPGGTRKSGDIIDKNSLNSFKVK